MGFVLCSSCVLYTRLKHGGGCEKMFWINKGVDRNIKHHFYPYLWLAIFKTPLSAFVLQPWIRHRIVWLWLTEERFFFILLFSVIRIQISACQLITLFYTEREACTASFEIQDFSLACVQWQQNCPHPICTNETNAHFRRYNSWIHQSLQGLWNEMIIWYSKTSLNDIDLLNADGMWESIIAFALFLFFYIGFS